MNKKKSRIDDRSDNDIEQNEVKRYSCFKSCKRFLARLAAVEFG